MRTLPPQRKHHGRIPVIRCDCNSLELLWPKCTQPVSETHCQAWPRPAVRELNDLVRILGEEIHAMLLRNKKPQAALHDAQARCDRLMIENGRNAGLTA